MASHGDTPGEHPLRYALIGCAATIAPLHLQALAQLPAAEIVGMSDIAAERGVARAQEIGCPFFVDHRALLAELQPDVAVICTPHPFHAPQALDCFAAGAHVLVEKPMAIDVAEADAMIAAADSAGRLLAVNLQQRFRPAIEYARKMIETGELGDIVRVLCVEPWFRTDAYYRSATWRGTWKGEGGGVLMNQAPHTLDLLCHLAGPPIRVWGWARTLRHPITTEDTAQAMLEFANGAPGYLHVNTIETRQQARLQIVGNQAALDLVGDQLSVYHFNPPLHEHMQTSADLFSKPDVRIETLLLPPGGDHLAVYRDLDAAIREGHHPRADGREGLMSLELANAITFSNSMERAVSLPLDRSAYRALLGELQRHEEAVA